MQTQGRLFCCFCGHWQKTLLKGKKLQKCHITELSPAVGNRLLDKNIKLVVLGDLKQFENIMNL